MIAEFALAHPQISLEVHHAERRVDLIGEGFDAAIRVGSLEPVLPDWQPEGDGAIHLVRPSARFTSAAMEAFRQWMLDGFARTPWAPSPRPTSPTL